MRFLAARRGIQHLFGAGVLALSSVGGHGQQPGLGFNENVVFLDPAHGGADSGAHLGRNIEEKDVTLRMAARLRAALMARGFTVITSRDGDQTMVAEQRAGAANHARPLACILLHATSSVTGAVLAVSALNPDTEPKIALPWGMAQASYVSQSLALRETMMGALISTKIKTISLRASTPPLDSLTCAAVTLEMAGSAAIDEGYQTKTADTITQALIEWKAKVVLSRPSQPVSGGSTTKASTGSGDHGAER